MNVRKVITAVILLAGMGWLASLSTAVTRQDEEAGGKYTVDPVHSALIFGLTHMKVGYFYGRINGPSGEFSFDPEDPSSATFTIEASTDKIDTANGKRDGHLKSADFFNAKQFPKITFKSTKVSKAGGNKYEVSGTLTLHGVTKPITIELNHIGSADTRRGDMAGFQSTFTINRSDYGIDYMPKGLGEEVTIMIGIEGRR